MCAINSFVCIRLIVIAINVSIKSVQMNGRRRADLSRSVIYSPPIVSMYNFLAFFVVVVSVRVCVRVFYFVGGGGQTAQLKERVCKIVNVSALRHK